MTDKIGEQPPPRRAEQTGELLLRNRRQVAGPSRQALDVVDGVLAQQIAFNILFLEPIVCNLLSVFHHVLLRVLVAIIQVDLLWVLEDALLEEVLLLFLEAWNLDLYVRFAEDSEVFRLGEDGAGRIGAASPQGGRLGVGD